MRHEQETIKEKLSDIGFDAVDSMVAVLSVLDEMRIVTQERIRRYLKRIVSTGGHSGSNWR